MSSRRSNSYWSGSSSGSQSRVPSESVHQELSPLSAVGAVTFTPEPKVRATKKRKLGLAPWGLSIFWTVDLPMRSTCINRNVMFALSRYFVSPNFLYLVLTNINAVLIFIQIPPKPDFVCRTKYVVERIQECWQNEECEVDRYDMLLLALPLAMQSQ